MKWVGENLCLWSVSGAARNGTWHVDDNYFRTQRCAILSLPALEPRVFSWWNVIMLCNSVRAVFALLDVFCKQAKPVLTLKKKPPRVRAWRMLRIPLARFPMELVPRWRRWRSCLQVGPRSWRSCLHVSPWPFVEPPNCFSGRPRSHLLRFPRIVVLFAVLFVDCEERSCILLGSLPSFHHAIVCILFLLGQSRVVDWVVAEVLLHLSWESNASNFEFSQPLWRLGCASPRRFCRTQHYVFLSTRCHTTNFCTIRWRTMLDRASLSICFAW